MTQAQVAKKIGLTAPLVFSYETDIRLPSYDMLIRIADLFGVMIDYDIQQFCAWMKSDDHIGGSGISDSQIRNCYSLCHRTPEKARAEHLILRDPTDRCKSPPVRCEEMKILSREAMQKLLVQAWEENYYELFLLELSTGLRLGEIAALQWNDLNLEAGELRINKQAGTVGPEE